MAGSLGHLTIKTDQEGKHGGWSLIENMGDAYEATHELLYLVVSEIGIERAEKILNTKYYPRARGEKKLDQAYRLTEEMMNN